MSLHTHLSKELTTTLVGSGMSPTRLHGDVQTAKKTAKYVT